MSFDDNNYDTPDEEQLPEESSNNRTFLIAVGILGGIILLSVACIVGIFLVNRNNQSAQQAQSQSATQTAEASNNFINQALTATAEAQAVLPTATLPPTATLVVNVATTTNTPDPNATGIVALDAPATATVGAALTQAAIAQLTIVPTTTALPNTGFIDDYGVPGLAVMALAFIMVILLARRLRASPTR
jgi:flagellar basal body-associated protein FliL